MEPLISVIVPVYNVEKYLDRCVESIVNQTYTNLEIILVDDGSPDNCPKMCDDWAKKDDRIKVIHKKNGGLSDARNSGLNICRGAYISFVDSDDYVSNEYIMKLFFALKLNDADMSICNVEKIFVDNAKYERSNIQNKILNQQEYFDKMEEYGGWCWVVAWNKLYKKEIFEQLRYPKGKLYEDDYIIHNIIYSITRIAAIDDILYYYVQREGSIISNGFSSKNLASSMLYFDRCLLFLEKGEPIKRIDFCLRMSVNSLYKAYENKLYLDDKKIIKEFLNNYKMVWSKAKLYKFRSIKRVYYGLNCYVPRIIFLLKSIYMRVR